MHDAHTRLLQRIPPDTEALGQEVSPFVRWDQGVWVVDDTTLDKPYARKVGLATRHWWGKHHRVGQGILWISLLGTQGEERLPCAFRIDNRAEDGLTKNDHFQAMLQTAFERGFAPEPILFDRWYASLTNLKCVHLLEGQSMGVGGRPTASIALDQHGRSLPMGGGCT